MHVQSCCLIIKSFVVWSYSRRRCSCLSFLFADAVHCYLLKSWILQCCSLRDFIEKQFHCYNPGQNSLGQYCNIHIFLSFLVSLLKECVFLEIFLQFSLHPPYTKLKLGTNSEYARPTLFVEEGRGWTCVNWKTPQKSRSVPRLLSMIVGVMWPQSNQWERAVWKKFPAI